jgi:hypothetical protein
VQLGIRKLRGAVDGDIQVELAVFGTHFGTIDVEIADWIGLERLLLGLVTLNGWRAADAVPLQTTVECRSRQVGNGRLQGVQALIQRQQRLPANCHN